ncbi:MAG TPA: hypothetical protein VL400_22785 [Polyangiaceae bacterium]|nr:hypothetical protein [Polyangiaceae bacterium]
MNAADSSKPGVVGLAWGGIGVIVATVVVMVGVRDPVFASVDRAPKVAASDDAGAARAGDDDASRARPKTTGTAGSMGGTKPDVFPNPFGGGTSDDKSDVAPLPGQATRELAGSIDAKLRKNDLKGALDSLEKLVDTDKDAIKDPSVRESIVDLSQRVTLLTHGEPERMFGLLAKKMGTTGIDILYQLVTTKGGSRAAKLAEALLLEEDILERGSPAVQVAWKLRRAKGCEDKKALFGDAAKNGDGRTLGQLYLLNRSCNRRRRDPSCCLEKDKDLDATMDAIKARGFQ